MESILRMVGWMYQLTLALALIAYDCSTPEINTTVISRRDVAPCPDEKANYQTDNTRVQVIQRDRIKRLPVNMCVVEVNRLIVHCGMHSHTSLVAGGLANYIHPLGPDNCHYLHKHRSFQIHGHTIGNILMNGTTSAEVTLLGRLERDGTCKGVSYSENSQTWDNVVVQASIKITTADYFAIVRLDTNEIRLRSGVTCSYLKGYCLDSSSGETVWRTSTTSACTEVTTLYQGGAAIITEKVTRKQILVVEDSDRVFALALIKKSSYCGVDVLQSEHPRILVINLKKTGGMLSTTKLNTENVNLLTYMNSKFLYLEQSFKRNIDAVYTDILRRRCELHREVLKTKLQTAPLSPDTIATLVNEEQGYIGRVLGEAIYLMKCTPKPVTLRRTTKCYIELPILVGNQSKFMAPITHIIQDAAEEVDCTSITPPLYYIKDRWVGFTPDPINRNPPSELSVNTEEKITFSPIQPLGVGGIYTPEEVERSQNMLRFGNERRAVENIVIRRISGSDVDNQGFATTKLFDKNEMKLLARNTFKQLWGWFTDIGIVTSGLMGVYFIFRVFKYILSVAINSWQIYRAFGCGLSVFAGIWNTLTLLVLHKHYVKQQQGQGQSHDSPLNEPQLSDPEPSVQLTPVYPEVPAAHWSDQNNK